MQSWGYKERVVLHLTKVVVSQWDDNYNVFISETITEINGINTNDIDLIGTREHTKDSPQQPSFCMLYITEAESEALDKADGYHIISFDFSKSCW